MDIYQLANEFLDATDSGGEPSDPRERPPFDPRPEVPSPDVPEENPPYENDPETPPVEPQPELPPTEPVVPEVEPLPGEEPGIPAFK